MGVLSAGCALRPSKPPEVAMPAAFGQPAATDRWPSQDWYRNFGSTELDALIDQAARSNLDVTQAQARIAQADARARQAHAAILPSVDANGNVNYLAGHSSNGSAHETDWSALLSANYEVDFWGKNRAAADSAHYSAVASRAERDTIALTALAGVANNYFEILSLRERLNVAQQNVDAARGLVAIVEARFQVGMANPSEVAIEKAALANAELTLPELQRTQSEALAALAELLGQAPEGFTVQGAPLDAINEPAVGAGLPSELLARRPDIFTAEANLKAANADLVVARAALFPSLSLTAAGGLQNPAMNAAVNSLAGVGPSLSLGASLTQPIFNAGKLLAVRAEARAKEEELVAGYRAAIISALVDVEKSLSAIHQLDAARDAQTQNLEQSELAYQAARVRYQEGLGDFLAVLEAQKTLYAAREQYAQYKLARLQALVSLCKALGGGWQAPHEGAPQSARNENPR
jgi:multidrug efflux system outer membrane protein